MSLKRPSNLFLLGIGSLMVTMVTTVVSLAIYHWSGDIYLDRSRPGFLPDEQEIQQEPAKDYKFSDTEQLTKNSLDEYLGHYQERLDALNELEDPYSAEALSDESLGIPKDTTRKK